MNKSVVAAAIGIEIQSALLAQIINPEVIL